jgi:hypothetical protein
MSLCSRRFTGAQGLDGPNATSVGLGVTCLTTIMTAGFWLLTGSTRGARRTVGADATCETRLMRGGPAGPKSFIYHFAVKALLALI